MLTTSWAAYRQSQGQASAVVVPCVLFTFLIYIHLRSKSSTRQGVSASGYPPDSKQPTRWEDIRNQKLDDDAAKIPIDWLLDFVVSEDDVHPPRSIAGEYIMSLLDEETRTITSLDAPELVNLTTSGMLSAEVLTRSFCKRAAIAHQLNKSLLEINFESAIARARELDIHFQREGKPIGPLHGLPITLKDQFHVKGLNTTMGYVGWIDTFEGDKDSPLKGTAESELVRELESLGAIIIGKTTCVQSLWFGETNNNILGYNRNPVNQRLSSGGSSGEGEGAIQSLGGSAAGVGTDIGGSVSMPASYNGVYSIKPSAHRLSFKNVANSSKGQANIPTVPGFLGRSVASLRLLFESVLSTEPWVHDPEVLPIPWRDEETRRFLEGKLSFGLFEHDGVVRPHPPIERALRMVAKAVEAQGHSVIEWQPPDHREAELLHGAIVNADGNYDVPQQLALSGEPFIKELRPYFPSSSASEPLDAIQVEKWNQRLEAFRNDYNDYWVSTGEVSGTGRPVDALLMPVTPTAAVIPGNSFYYTYVSICNTLDYVTIVIPVTFADESLDELDPSYRPDNEVDGNNWRAYDAKIYHGAPAGIQIVGRRLEEEKLLAVAQRVVDALDEFKRKPARDAGGHMELVR